MLSDSRREFTASWQTNRELAFAEIRARIEALGESLEFASEPSLYALATLDDLLDELVNASFAALARARPRASIALSVRDSKWVSHLHDGDEFDSVAYPLGTPT